MYESDILDPAANASQSPHSTESNHSGHSNANAKKRSSTSAAAVDSNGNPKPVKRRAAKACAACRARKVRCDVMQRYHITADGEVTCSNCTMDGIKCVIEESKRRKKHLNPAPQASNPNAPISQPASTAALQSWGNGVVSPSDITTTDARRWSGSSVSDDLGEFKDSHVPHPIYQSVSNQINKGELLRKQAVFQAPYDDPLYPLMASAAIHGDRTRTRIESPPVPPAPFLKHKLPDYLKPLPQRMTSVDIDYLFAKGALSLPENRIRNALLRSYVEFVHPYMPLIELHDTLTIIDDETGGHGKVSLLLFQAIMFAGTAFVDMGYLRKAGFNNRKAARKAFFQKARVLYDFDYEVDRVSLVQSLLLMTYWYETPDDQKDTWHWMGVAISLAHTIGLHRNPEKSNMEPHKKKLWKRIWWSCFMRDRLVALGMRRPTRVKDEDYDVPMLQEEDFEIRALADTNSVLGAECTLVRDVDSQRELALMCIAKAKLSVCISHVLSAQYSVLVRHQGMQGQEGSTRSSVMLFPKKLDQTDEVQRCDFELTNWVDELPQSCLYTNELGSGGSAAPLFVQRALLHMIYFTTLSALHRPQVLPSANTSESPLKLQDLSRKKVRAASREITRIAQSLHTKCLERYLPTTGVTVLLPAIIIHLLDIKSCNDEARQQALDGFCQCMLVLEKLRDNYSSADFATQFLDAAIRKADIDAVMGNARDKMRHEEFQTQMSLERFREMRERSRMAAMRRTPPTSGDNLELRPDFPGTGILDTGNSVYRSNKTEQNTISARTPPDQEETMKTVENDEIENEGDGLAIEDSNIDLNDFLNFGNDNDMWNVPLEEGAHGESGGFLGDMNWVDHLPGWSRLSSPQVDQNLDLYENGIPMEVETAA